MIRTETFYIDEREFIRSWSDSGLRIMQETGAVYDEAVDVAGTTHSYTETDEPISEEITDTEALNILLGRGADEIQ